MKNKNIQTEIDACFLYQRLAEHEPDATIANVFKQMSDIEKSHAEAFAKKENISFENLMQPSWRAKTLNTIGTAITIFTGKNVWYSGFRQVLFGLIATAITFGIGHLIGVSVNG